MEYNNEYNLELYPKKLHWQEGELTATRTTMWSGPGCHEGCQIIFYTDRDDKLVKIEGDPNSPFTQGRLCMRCLELTELVNHPDRLRYPLKRVGKRGEDKWERITWDEAYDIIEKNVRTFQQESGPESIISMIGTGRNVSQVIAHNQYANFGGPDLTLCFLSGDSCMLPRTALCFVVMGNQWVADMSQFRSTRYEEDPDWRPPECIVIWGTNPVINNADAFLGHWIVECMKRGSELITIDPMLTWIGAKSKYWLRLRPGTDAALALGMLNVLINEDLVDHTFIDEWTWGYDELKERVQEYPPEKVAEITWVDKDLIIEAARFYAKAHPSTIQWGLAVDMSKIGTVTAHAIACLAGVTGNIDNPGGNVLIDQASGLEFGYNSGIEYLAPGMVEKRLGNSKYPLKKYGFTASSQSDTILEAIETGVDENGRPRPVRMLWIQSSNPITNMGQDAPRIYRAMDNVDFIVDIDLFKTPFAVACSDLLLPCAMSNERDCIRVWFDPMRSLTKCSSYYEAKEDEQIMIDLGHRLSPQFWPEWVQTPRDYMNWRMEVGKVGFTMEDLEQKYAGMHYGDFRYFKYEKGLLRPDGEPGFFTPTGKYEFFITLYDSWGDDPLPFYEEPPTSPYSTPEMFKKYPLVLTTGKRSFEFFHSEWRQAETTSRELHPFPRFEIHPETARTYGVAEGEWAWIENHLGRFRQIAHFNETLDPRVISTEHGWWFPEKEAAEPSLFGVFDCNPNNAIPMNENGASGYGAPIKCGIAKVYPVTPENSTAEMQPTYQVTREGGYTHG
ncbi:MAG: molybdopterin-dependent oxidoreductase [Coriobacteriales bacterium]|jgi:anaerobic selenocysteine-containing dehydrogenase|nr:molybdopterin-dependent oxidoreductase [Coriobacteriales bacterium]